MDTKAVSVFLAGIAAGAAIALAATSSRRSSHGRHGSGDTGKASETSATASTRKSSAKSQQTQMIAASSAGAKPKAGNPLNADTSAGGRLSKRPRKSSHNTDQNFFPFEFPPIGRIRSCFRECRGTPRQGSFAPSTRGFLEFQKRVPANSTDGLEAFSHVWILFIFHTNTNLHHSKRAHNGGGSHSFRSKIKPPKLKGKSIGVFASRTPHRPNAIGITLAKIERVDGRRIDLSALDLLDGTPVLDIKPCKCVHEGKLIDGRNYGVQLSCFDTVFFSLLSTTLRPTVSFSIVKTFLVPTEKIKRPLSQTDVSSDP